MGKTQRYTCLSSELYPLVAADLLPRVTDAAEGGRPTPAVMLRLDATAPRGDDVPCGGDQVRAAVARGDQTVPVRVAFSGYSPGLTRWVRHLIHPLRKKTTRTGTGVYHMDPRELRRLGLEILVRHEANAYRAISRTLLPAGKEQAHWGHLKKSIQVRGFKDQFPIVILLRRTAGFRDRLLQGHHRLAIAIELGLPVVPVSFAYAGHAPAFLTAIYDRLRSGRRASRISR